jgi:hypothetical protein
MKIRFVAYVVVLGGGITLLVSNQTYGVVLGAVLIAITVGTILVVDTPLGGRRVIVTRKALPKDSPVNTVIAMIAVDGTGSTCYYVPRGLTENDLLVVGIAFTQIDAILGRAGSPGYRIDVLTINGRPDDNVPIATRVD